MRRYARHLPVPVAPRVLVPVHTERIICIVIHPQDAFDEDVPLPFPAEVHALQPIFDKSPIADAARKQAYIDIEEIQALAEEKNQAIIIDQNLHFRRLRLKAREEAAKGAAENYKQLRDRFLVVYRETFEEEKKLIATDLKVFPDEKAVNLSRKARADRKKYTFPSSGKGPFHQRDLAVVSALCELDLLCRNVEDFLARIHPYADIYEDSWRNPGEEVVWPPF